MNAEPYYFLLVVQEAIFLRYAPTDEILTSLNLAFLFYNQDQTHRHSQQVKSILSSFEMKITSLSFDMATVLSTNYLD